MIKQFLREKNTNRRIGVMIASNIDDVVHIGMSAVAPEDVFDPALGERIAVARALKGGHFINRYRKDLFPFVERCVRYFKDCKFQPKLVQFLD